MRKKTQTNHITFEPGARSGWHTHGGMIILVTGGVGYYQEEGKPAQIIRKGDVLECPEGVRHWHGAAPDSWFSQMVIYDSQYRGPGESGEDRPVTDAEYASLETEEYEGRNVDADNPFMFQRGNNPTTWRLLMARRQRRYFLCTYCSKHESGTDRSGMV